MIIVDDGLATGSTMRAAVAAVRQSAPARVVVAVPVAAERTCEMLREQVDEVVCALFPEPFRAVHQGYRDFTSDPGRRGDRPAASRLVLSLLMSVAITQ